MILFQLSEREDYDIICHDVEGKVSVSASSSLTSVEVYYRHQITSTHWRGLKGIHMLNCLNCIVHRTYVRFLLPTILKVATMHGYCVGYRVGETCPGSHAPPVNSYTSKLKTIIIVLFLTMFKK